MKQETYEEKVERIKENVNPELVESTLDRILKEGEEQIPHSNTEYAEKGRDNKGRFMKGNPGKQKGSRLKITQRMLDHAASLPMSPEEVMASLFTDPMLDPELRLKAAKVYGDWVYYKAPNVEVTMDVEFDSAAAIEDQIDLFLERSESEEQKNKFSRIRKFGYEARGCTEEDFKAFIEAYGAVPEKQEEQVEE